MLSVIAIIILVGAVIFVRANLPSLAAVTPNDGATHVAVASPLRLTFSEAMRPESVTQNLQIQPSTTGSFSWEANTLTFTPAQAWPSGEEITVTLKTGARSTLGLPLLREQSWSFSSSPPLLIYLWPHDGPADLYAIDLVDNIEVRLTEQLNGILNYDIRADGTQIYYSARTTLKNSAIFQLDRVADRIQQILICTNIRCDFPQLSPQGDYLAYTRSPANPDRETFPQQVWLLPIKDGIPQPESQARLVSDPQHPAGSPIWSPSGLLTFHDKVQQAFVVYDPQKQETRLIPNETGEHGTWAPDGRDFIIHEVDFWGSGPMDFSSHLWRFEMPAAQGENLSLDLDLEDVTPAYAPDGQQIAFGRRYLDPVRFTIGSQLWLMDANGRNPRQITHSPDYNHADFAWHPDGSYLAFVRHQQTTLIDPPEIWIILPDGSDAVRLVIGGYGPQWIP